MKKALVYGVGKLYRSTREQIQKECEVIAFIDDNPGRLGAFVDGIEILDPGSIGRLKFDIVYVGTLRYDIVREKLLAMGIPADNIRWLLDVEKKRIGACESDRYEADGIRIDYFTDFDRYMASEVFEENTYNIANIPENTVVLDIGMHIGCASLYFARMKSVSRVYAYEPFPSTYDKALWNISLNGHLSGKIIPKCCAIGECEKKLSIDFSQDMSSNMSIIPEKNSRMKSECGESNDFVVTEITVLDACREFDAIFDENPGSPMICKIDCEGYEKNILDRLDSEKMIGRFDAFMLERHHKAEVAHITGLFKKYGFVCFDLGIRNYDYGMMYAVNTHKQP